VAQAATLGQTYGMLSGNPHDLLMTESFHGTIIAWARQAGMFRKGSPDHLQVVNARNLTDPGTLESAWRSWAQAEETARVVLALHVHDSEFAVIFHHEPLLRHDPERPPPLQLSGTRCWCRRPLRKPLLVKAWTILRVKRRSCKPTDFWRDRLPQYVRCEVRHWMIRERHLTSDVASRPGTRRISQASAYLVATRSALPFFGTRHSWRFT